MTQFHVTMLGDSLTAGYGLRADEALPVRLQAELAALGLSVAVRNAGVSGDTVADGLRRLDRDVPMHTDLCLVALGANDLLRKVAPKRTEADLEAILDRLRARGVTALICGMRAPPWSGFYGAAFDRVFPDVARRQGAALYPFLLEGIALDPAFALADRIHPNARGVAIVARRLAPVVAAALDARVGRDRGVRCP